MNTLDLLDRPIAFHRVFVTITGSVNAALLMSQSVYWTRRTKDPDGWFYKTLEEWTDETGLGRHELVKARKRLLGLGLMDYRVGGMPARSYYRIIETAILEAFKGNVRELTVEQIIKLYDTELVQLSAVGYMRAKRLKVVEVERVDYADVLRANGNECYRCHRTITQGPGQSGLFLAFDHVKAIAAGGAHTAANIRPTHALCNSQKSGEDKLAKHELSLLGLDKLDGIGPSKLVGQPQAGMSVSAKKSSSNKSTETTSETTSLVAVGLFVDWHAERLGKIFHRQHPEFIAWSDKERKAYGTLTHRGKRPLDDNDLMMVERYYAANRKKADNICRRDLLTLLNHYAGEVDRARAWCEKNPLRAARTVRNASIEPTPEPVNDTVWQSATEDLRSFRNRMRNGSHEANQEKE